ncbi:hypothetical protein KW787_03080 [Candidatus Pacearchaeota archaeon]|nr:hypothetical protein [Candidatus Pacearchaeota archaeon]
MQKKKNYMDELVEYLRKNLKKGYTKESLKWALVNQGYSRIEVDNALKIVDQKLANEAPILKAKPTINYEVVDPKPNSYKQSFWKRLFGG